MRAHTLCLCLCEPCARMPCVLPRHLTPRTLHPARCTDTLEAACLLPFVSVSVSVSVFFFYSPPPFFSTPLCLSFLRTLRLLPLELSYSYYHLPLELSYSYYHLPLELS